MSAVATTSVGAIILAGARRLTLPLITTSAAIGASMIVGDAACQWIQFKAEQTKLMESHARAVLTNPGLPLPDVTTILAAPPRKPDARVPELPSEIKKLTPHWWDANRGLAMFVTGFVAGGPWQFTIQRSAEHFFPGRSISAIAKKMTVNMSTAPIGISSTFFLTNYFQGGPNEAAVTRIKNDLGTTFVTGFLYWPFVSFFNLKLVNVEYRPIVGSLAGAVWNIYISAQANKPPPVPPCEDQPIVVGAPASVAATLQTTIQPPPKTI